MPDTIALKTLSESGYKGWPYIHRSGDVCFVWYEKNPSTGRQCSGFHWQSFNRTRSSGKLAKRDFGDLVPVEVPSRYFGASVTELLAEVDPLPKLRKGREWVGPFLYMAPRAVPVFGDHGTHILARRVPATSAGISIGYQASADLTRVQVKLTQPMKGNS